MRIGSKLIKGTYYNLPGLVSIFVNNNDALKSFQQAFPLLSLLELQCHFIAVYQNAPRTSLCY